jgi:hypothetical protein
LAKTLQSLLIFKSIFRPNFENLFNAHFAQGAVLAIDMAGL